MWRVAINWQLSYPTGGLALVVDSGMTFFEIADAIRA